MTVSCHVSVGQDPGQRPVNWLFMIFLMCSAINRYTRSGMGSHSCGRLIKKPALFCSLQFHNLLVVRLVWLLKKFSEAQKGNTGVL